MGFLLETEGSDLSGKAWETVPVHLVLVWSKSEGRKPSYGPKTVLQNIGILFFIIFGSGARIWLFSTSNSDSVQTTDPDRHPESSEMMKNRSKS